MTESEWLAATEPAVMLLFLQDKVSDRKKRLFTCACCRENWGRLTNWRSRKAVEVAERFADGENIPLLLAHVRRSAEAAIADKETDFAPDLALSAVQDDPNAGFGPAIIIVFDYTEDWVPDVSSYVRLLRHMFGNPWRRYPAPASWPSPVVALAQALYDGDTSARDPLQDALLDAGHPELAAHFREEVSCMKGCWALDVITGRK